jgi:hypothetical protein
MSSGEITRGPRDSGGRKTRKAMRHIEVQYRDETHAFVDDYLLDSLIRSGKITHFYRPSEGRWIQIGVDPTRKGTSAPPGRERRRTAGFLEMLPRVCDSSADPCLSRQI